MRGIYSILHFFTTEQSGFFDSRMKLVMKKSILSSEDPNIASVEGESVVVDGEQEDEGEEEGGGAEEVPHVVVVEEVHHAAHLVHVPRLGRREVPALVPVEVVHHGHGGETEGKEDAETATEDETEAHLPVLGLPLSAVHHLEKLVADVVEEEGGHVGRADHQDRRGETLRAGLESARQEEAHEDEVDEDQDDGKGKALRVKTVDSVSGGGSQDCCSSAYSSPEAAFCGAVVVDVKGSLHEDGEVEKAEGDVANDFATNREDVEAAGLKDKGTSKGVHHWEGLGRDVWVSELVEFDEDQDQHHVHHCSVELKADIARADMEDTTEDSLKSHTLV